MTLPDRVGESNPPIAMEPGRRDHAET